MRFSTINKLLKTGLDFSHNKLRTSGLTETELHICSFVSEHPKCSQDDVVQALKIDKTTVAKAVKSLEGKELLGRCRHDADKRMKELTLTEAGSARIAQIVNLHDEWFNGILNCLSETEKIQFEEYVTRLLQQAEKHIESED